jgi:hypothetical protein
LTLTDISGIEELLRLHGLVILGLLPDAVLVGNAGSSCWRYFERSAEYMDGQPHPMDRWSRRIGLAVAKKLDAQPVFPFEGPPYPPVLAWALKSGQAQPSPISMYIHRDYGLWHAHRFALFFSKPLPGIKSTAEMESPCLSCVGQPCLEACPVGAFDENIYRVDDCIDFLASDENSSCRQRGCGARRACPAGVEFRYRASHARFHMEAFLVSQKTSKK